MSETSNLYRKQIYLTGELNQRLRRNAAKAGVTESSIIREALEEYLAGEERRHTPAAENPVLQMAGMFEGDPTCRDVSDRVDEHLAEGLLKKQ